jgi:hypothetical protein
MFILGSKGARVKIGTQLSRVPEAQAIGGRLCLIFRPKRHISRFDTTPVKPHIGVEIAISH